MIGAWATARIEADALLVSSHFAAHFATGRFEGPSIVYYHTPARMHPRQPGEQVDQQQPAEASSLVVVAVAAGLSKRAPTPGFG